MKSNKSGLSKEVVSSQEVHKVKGDKLYVHVHIIYMIMHYYKVHVIYSYVTLNFFEALC